MTELNPNEFGNFLRSRRERINPEAVSLAGGQRRRTPGLRRQEVAELAGIGIDWYIRLEQGRAISPSATTLDALARALRLTKVEHAHLKALAKKADRRPFTRETVPETLARLVERLGQPAYVTGRRWDVLIWNEAAADIFSGCLSSAEEDRNILIFMLLDPQAKRLFGDGWAEEARRVVAQFRTTHDLWSGDPAFSSLVARLRAGSPEFELWWEDHEVRNVGAGRKVLHHPSKGRMVFEYGTFQANDDPTLKLALYTLVEAR